MLRASVRRSQSRSLDVVVDAHAARVPGGTPRLDEHVDPEGTRSPLRSRLMLSISSKSISLALPKPLRLAPGILGGCSPKGSVASSELARSCDSVVGSF